jgi:membrane-associated phospholipid phosphatase
MRANLIALVLTAATPVATAGQHAVRWYEAGGALAGVAALTLVDEPVQRWMQRQRGATSDDIAAALRHGGQPEVYVTVTLGLIGAGVVARRPALTRAGARAGTAMALAAATELSLKTLIGRARPFSGLGAHHFHPFHGSYSMPSGHTTLAFALATSLADDVRSPALRVGLYGLALGTGWSRMNDDAHWLSDVASGALIGITAAKVVNGRWRVFGLKPPRVLLGPERATILWNAPF